MFTERLLDHFRNPRNIGELPPPAFTVQVENPACGDVMRLSIQFESGHVTEARYKVRGCTASIAAGSALTEWLRGRSREEIALFRTEVIDAELGGVPAASHHVTILCSDAVKAVLAAATAAESTSPETTPAARAKSH
jgi:nitrogen fixation NifU-like protein